MFILSLGWLDVNINEPAINKQVRQICFKASTLTGDNKIAWLLKAISFLDLTTLNSDDTSSTVKRLCEKVCTDEAIETSLFFKTILIDRQLLTGRQSHARNAIRVGHTTSHGGCLRLSS